MREPGIVDRGPSLAFDALFSGRPSLEAEPTFSIRANRNTLHTDVRFVWVRQVASPQEAGIRYIESEGPEFDPDAVPGFRVVNQSNTYLLPVDRLSRLYVNIRRRSEADLESSSVVYLPSSGMTTAQVGRVWDTIALTDDEDQVIDSLRIIAPTLEKLVMVQSPDGRSERMLMAKLREFRGPVPFKSLGEGTVHLLSVILALLKARGGVVLMDEVENGVHYSVQSDLWALIFEQCGRSATQVFASTHSWDCVEGFAHGGRRVKPSMGAMFRLENSKAETEAVRFSVDEIEIAGREHIEVR